MQLPLSEKPYLNIDETARVGIAAFIDAAKDDAMNNTRRPGLKTFVQVPTGKPIDSAYEWVTKGFLVVVSAGRIWQVKKDKTVQEITGATLSTGNPVTFADFGSTLYMANGGRIIKWSGGGTCEYLSDPDAPSSVTHLGIIDQYLVALSGDLVWFAEVAEPENWRGEFFSAESLKDTTRALHIGWREIALFGDASIEYWASSGSPSAPFQRLEGTQTERGIIAPYSIQKIDNTYFFLDDERKIIRLAGRDPQIISNPFDAEIQRMDVASDTRSMHIHCDGQTFYVLTFPTQKKTFAYDYKRDVWSQWSYWDNAGQQRLPFIGQTACYMRSWNMHFVGSRDNGTLYEASMKYTDDDSIPMVWEIHTGWLGNSEWKIVSELVLQLKRGFGAALVQPEPFMEVSYRERNADPQDKNDGWSTPRMVNLGQLGEMDHIYRLFRLGRYRTRQYRFRCASSVPLVLMAGVEK